MLFTIRSVALETNKIQSNSSITVIRSCYFSSWCILVNVANFEYSIVLMNVGFGLGALVGPSLILKCLVQDSREIESARESSLNVGMVERVLMIRLSSSLEI